MPKIFGTSLIGILAATVVFFLLGFLWYGVLFHEMWMGLAGISAEAAAAKQEAVGSMTYVWGILITLMQVLGLAYILNHAGASLLTTCAKVCAVVAALIALPILAYANVYGIHYPVKLLGLDFAHLLIGYVLVGIILSFFRGKDAIGD